jgi:hypothetical protein
MGDGPDLRGIVLSLCDRVLMLEAGFKAPLSYVDRQMAEALNKKRWEPHDAKRRFELFKQAEAEAERVGHRGPIDDFVGKLMRGELDRHPRQSNGENAEVRPRTS